jgi:predicted GNAT family acetyltransferase
VRRPDIVYICGVQTLPEYRRRGLARALLLRIHADALLGGAQACLLSSTEMGFPLYESLGYRVVATRQAWKPARQAC